MREFPYPSTLSRKDKESQFARFQDSFQQLHINIPFLDALEHMPNYASDKYQF